MTYHDEGQQATMGFVQVRLAIAAMGINNIAALVLPGKASLNISSYYLTLSKAKQRFRADRNYIVIPATKPVRYLQAFHPSAN